MTTADHGVVTHPSRLSTEGDPRDGAPGLTLELINGLLKDAYVAGHAAGAHDAKGPAYQDGYYQGSEDAKHRVMAGVRNVVRARLNHTSSKLGPEHSERRGKTTIAAEREYMAAMRQELENAIHALEAIA